MSETNPRVSVVIPTYKRDAKYLLRAINSIKNQTYKNTEIVIVDDNSPDSEHRKTTIEFIKRYANDPDIIYYVNEKNMGGSLARNNGIEAATGEYITFLDDDDEYLKDKIKDQLLFMLKNKYDATFTNFISVNEKNEIIEVRNHHRLTNIDNESLIKYHLMRHITGTPTFMYKKTVLKKINGFEDVKMGQEFYLMLKTLEAGYKVGYFDKSDVLLYIHRDGGISQGNNKIKGENRLFEFKKTKYHLFNKKEIQFIRFRHYVVLAIAYLRGKKYFSFITNITIAFLISPMDFLNEFIKSRKSIMNIKGRKIKWKTNHIFSTLVIKSIEKL